MSGSPGRQSRSSKTQYIKRQPSKGSAGSYTGYKDARASRECCCDPFTRDPVFTRVRLVVPSSNSILDILYMHFFQRECIPAAEWEAVQCAAAGLERHKQGSAPMIIGYGHKIRVVTSTCSHTTLAGPCYHIRLLKSVEQQTT